MQFITCCSCCHCYHTALRALRLRVPLLLCHYLLTQRRYGLVIACLPLATTRTQRCILPRLLTATTPPLCRPLPSRCGSAGAAWHAAPLPVYLYPTPATVGVTRDPFAALTVCRLEHLPVMYLTPACCLLPCCCLVSATQCCPAAGCRSPFYTITPPATAALLLLPRPGWVSPSLLPLPAPMPHPCLFFHYILLYRWFIYLASLPFHAFVQDDTAVTCSPTVLPWWFERRDTCKFCRVLRSGLLPGLPCLLAPGGCRPALLLRSARPAATG